MTSTKTLRTGRLDLTPLAAADAAEMAGVLSDPALHTFTGGEPRTLDQIEELYRFQVAGSPRADETWHNWIVRLEGDAIGYVQATVTGDEADLAWLVGAHWQGQGYATEASVAMRDWLTDQGVGRFSAHIHPEHAASNGVAANLGLRPTGRLDDEGEMIWDGTDERVTVDDLRRVALDLAAALGDDGIRDPADALRLAAGLDADPHEQLLELRSTMIGTRNSWAGLADGSLVERGAAAVAAAKRLAIEL